MMPIMDKSIMIEFIKKEKTDIDKENMYLSMFPKLRTDSNFHARNPIIEVSDATIA